MNILHVVNVFFVVPYFLGDQLRYFKDKGNNLFLACSHSDELEEEANIQGFSYLEVPILREISVLQDIKSVFSLYKYIKNNNIDIVNGHTPKGALLAMIASFFARVPKRIYFRHGLVFETSRGFKRFLLISMDRLASFLATRIVCVSPSVYNKSIEYKLNPKNKQLILSKGTCNGINLQKFRRGDISEEIICNLKSNLNIPKDNFVIGFTGRLVKDKGIIDLVEAFCILSKEYSNITLLLVGMLEVRDGLPSNIVEEIKNNPLIINTGYIQNKDIPNYYALMDIYILPSYREGFPTSVLEASAMELPIITTKVTGCIDSIVEGVSGVFSSHDKEDISIKIKNFIENETSIPQYGKAGRTFVENNFDEKIVWEQINNLYR